MSVGGIRITDEDLLASLISGADERARLWEQVWSAYVKQYNAFRDGNQNWRAYFTAHHGSALDAALQVFGTELIQRAISMRWMEERDEHR